MCCFSRPVHNVTGTRIFARQMQPGVQAIAYSMRFAASEPVAMILPLPAAPGAGERGATFIDLKGYPHLFFSLDQPFQRPVQRKSGPPSRGASLGARPPLEVHKVGNFVATWVPTLSDFDRVDSQFRIAPEVWSKLPQYRDYGFAVFQLAPEAAGATTQVHPMALTFRTRWNNRLFFPTVHIHDGAVHSREQFDHELYTQGALKTPLIGGPRWETSEQNARDFVAVDRTQGLIDPDAPVRKLTLRGELPNRDTLTYLR